MRFVAPLLAVRDLKRARRFYETVLEQTVDQDFGTNLSFSGGFALQAGYAQMVGLEPDSLRWQPHCAELYFEEEDLEGFVRRLEKLPEIRYVHKLKLHPWGQRAIRFYDPDGHIIEVGEPMEQVTRRMMAEGLSPEQVAAQTGLSLEEVLKSC